MIALIPLALIFFCFSYLYLNDNLSIYTQSFVYISILLIVFFSIKLYNKIQEDIVQQELNKLLLEIDELKQKLSHTTNEQHMKGINNQIDLLTLEYKQKIQLN